jgi:dihydroorotate dehydrogenase electron transfer subunit
MKSRELIGIVETNKPLGGGYHLLSLKVAKAFSSPLAGSFVMLSVGNEPSLLLRRPMAVYDVRKAKSVKRLDLLYNVVGAGTRQMTKLVAGKELSFLGPIGNGFTLPKKGQSVWIVAGGIGIAPFLLYGRTLSAAQKKNVKTLFGFRVREQLGIVKNFLSVGLKPICALEQKGAHFKGTVVDLLRSELQKSRPDRILTCGPEKMMDAVRSAVENLSIPVEASLETKMACGVGVCLSCVTPHEGKYRLVCQEGPVFEFNASA